MLPLRNERKGDSEGNINTIQSGIANAVEELAMSRTLFQRKSKNALSRDLERLVEGSEELGDIVSEVSSSKKLTKETISNMLSKLKDDVSRYQSLRYLLENRDLSFELLKFLNEELEKLKRKRRKISSLDLISAETADIQQSESIDGLMFQRLYLNFLEYNGHICSYFEALYKSSKKYKKITKFISRMLNYEIYGITPSDDIDLYIYMNEKRKLLNIMCLVYSYFDDVKNKEENDKIISSDKNGLDDEVTFINAVLLNLDLDSLCSKMSTLKVSKLISYFNKVPVELFYSSEDKDDSIAIMRNNISHRFINNGLR